MPPSHQIDWFFAASFAASQDACALAEDWARKAGLPETLVLRLVIMIEELFTNTIKHGYCEESNRPVRISLDCREGLAHLDYRDQAPPFDPIHTPPIIDPDRPPDDVGGMGLLLIQTLGGNASYAHEDGWNLIRLSVSAAPAPGAKGLIAGKEQRKHRQQGK